MGYSPSVITVQVHSKAKPNQQQSLWAKTQKGDNVHNTCNAQSHNTNTVTDN